MKANEEIWRPVVGYEGLYEVSSEGRVKRLYRSFIGEDGRRQTITEEIMTPCNAWNKYKILGLRKDGKRNTERLSRLVARAFPEICGEWFAGCQVNHKDEDISNNRACNLEVCTAKYNVNYGSCIERRSKAKKKPVNQLTKEGVFIRRWDSATDAVKELGGSYSSIFYVLKGYQATGMGYRWEYA